MGIDLNYDLKKALMVVAYYVVSGCAAYVLLRCDCLVAARVDISYDLMYV